MFSPSTYPLGDVRVNESADAVFLREPGGKRIRQVTTSCGCTTVGKVAPDATRLVVEFSAGYLPEGIVEQGLTAYPVQKYMTVIYEDDTFDTLWLVARVYQ